MIDNLPKSQKGIHLLKDGIMITQLISFDEIKNIATKAAEFIQLNTYEEEIPILLVTLKGSVRFACEVMNRLRTPYSLEFIQCKSYEGTESTGRVFVNPLFDPINLRNRQVFIIENIVDTGRTIESLLKFVGEDVKVVTMLDKPSRRVVPVKINFVGKEIPDLFVIGFGLDYNGRYRDLNYIGVLTP